MTRLIPGSKEWYAAGLADAQKQLGAVWEALLDDVAGEYDDPAEAIQRAIHFRQKQLGAVWEALLDNYVGAYEDPAEAVKDVLALRDQQITNLRQSLVESHEREDDLDRAMVPLMKQVTTIEGDISAARVDGMKTGRWDVIQRMTAALEESDQDQTFVRGVLATLRTDRTWQR